MTELSHIPKVALAQLLLDDLDGDHLSDMLGMDVTITQPARFTARIELVDEGRSFLLELKEL